MTEVQKVENLIKTLEGLLAKHANIDLTKPAKSVDRFARKDKAILRGFAKKGIKNAVLMDRTDPTKAFNVRPFKGWVALGRIVKKGEHGVRGLFHESQTEELKQA